MQSNTLKKELGFFALFCFATGAMISSGLFVLPGPAFKHAGPYVFLSYIIAGLFCLPTIFSVVELATAMPKAGGDYYYVNKGFGPLLGTIAGFSAVFSLIVKSSFALIGLGAYIHSVVPYLDIKLVGVIFSVLFVVINIIGLKESARFQIIMVIALLIIFLVYCVLGLNKLNFSYYTPFSMSNLSSMISTAGFVFISYAGFLTITALAEEVKKPRHLISSLFVAMLSIIILYGLVVFIVVGTVPPSKLKETLTAVADSSSIIGDNLLSSLINIGAILSFVTTANALIMVAARYLFSMSRDKIAPSFFKTINDRYNTPHVSLIAIGLGVTVFILFIPLEYLVEIGSGLLLVLYILINITLIIFRSSKISVYDPKFYSPFYPYLQIIGILCYFFLLIDMGTKHMLIMTLIIGLFFIWYKFYVKKKTSQDSILLYTLERLIAKSKEFITENTITELREVVIERDNRLKDKFHNLIERSIILDIDKVMDYQEFFRKICGILSSRLSINEEELYKKFIMREEEVSTVMQKGISIPHIMVDKDDVFDVLIVRAKNGIIFPNDQVVHMIFILVGGKAQRRFHLKVLAALAQIIHTPDFYHKFQDAISVEEIKNIILLAERKIEI